MTDVEFNKLKEDGVALALQVRSYSLRDQSEEAVELRRKMSNINLAISTEAQRRDRLPPVVKPKPKVTIR